MSSTGQRNAVIWETRDGIGGFSQHKTLSNFSWLITFGIAPLAKRRGLGVTSCNLPSQLCLKKTRRKTLQHVSVLAMADRGEVVMAQWLDAKVVKRIDWNDHLFSLACSCADFPGFTPGQFTKFGVLRDGKIISRPYSLVNSSDDPHLEIIAVPVAEGVLSPKLHTLQCGDDIKVMAPATGFLVLDEVPDSQNLWLLATGTGVGPFLSILSGAEAWQRFEQITLVYAVRHANDLAYVHVIQHWLQQYPQRFSFIPVVSREPMPGTLRGRIPALLQSGEIQQQSQQSLQAADSQVMLCGNPQMVTDGLKVLTELGLKKHLRRSPGQISMERYW